MVDVPWKSDGLQEPEVSSSPSTGTLLCPCVAGPAEPVRCQAGRGLSGPVLTTTTLSQTHTPVPPGSHDQRTLLSMFSFCVGVVPAKADQQESFSNLLYFVTAD